MNALFTMGWRKLTGWLKRLEQDRKLTDQLEGMSERMLKDIGLKREDIPALVRGVLPPGRRAPLSTARRTRGFNPCPLCGRGEPISP